jgi:hypothetical protein
MMEVESESIYQLARDIVDHGTLNPTDPVIIVEEANRFVVLEGNRRLCALRLLRRPQLAPTLPDQNRFERLAKRQETPVDKVQVALADDREAASYWIELKHTGPGKGAGTKGWSPRAKRTFTARKNGTKTYIESVIDAIQDWYQEDDGMLKDLQTVIHGNQFTNFERLLEGKEGQEALGLRQRDNIIESQFPPESLQGFFGFLLKSLASPRGPKELSWSREWGNSDQRKQWLTKQADRLPADQLRSSDYEHRSTTLTEGPRPQVGIAPITRPKASLAKADAYKNPYDGPKLNVDGFIVHAAFPPPIHMIFGELKQLRVEDVPNATFDILRSFVEKTIKSFAYLQHRPVPTDKQYVQFGHCLIWLEKYCGDYKSLKQFKGSVSKIRTSSSNFAITADAYNAANHDHNVSYGPSDVREAWNAVHGIMNAMLRLGPDTPE